MVYHGEYYTGQRSEDIKKINAKIYSLGFLERKYVIDYYSIATENAVIRYQKYKKLVPTGRVNKETFKALFKSNAEFEDEDINKNVDDNTTKQYGDNNNDTFFSNNSDTIMRSNNNDITITYGEGNKSKTLKNVIFKSKTQAIDPNDGSLVDEYEFIARDLKETEDIAGVDNTDGRYI